MGWRVVSDRAAGRGQRVAEGQRARGAAARWCAGIVFGLLLVYNVPMYIETVPNRNSPPAVLLREGWREGSKTLKRTLANLSHWPRPKIDAFRRLLQDEPLVSPQDLFRTLKTLPHGHVEAILMAMHKL